MNAPYHQILPLVRALGPVESWNHTNDAKGTIPIGARVIPCHPYDATHTTVDATPDAPNGWPVTNPDGTPNGSSGYRFVVENNTLADALGVARWGKTTDLVGDLIAHESGTLNPKGTRRLVKTLSTNGLASRLQGHYGRLCAK